MEQHSFLQKVSQTLWISESWVRGFLLFSRVCGVVVKQASRRHHGTALLLLWFPYLQDVVQPGLPYLVCSSRVPAYCWCWQQHKSALSCLFAVLFTFKSVATTKHCCPSFNSFQRFIALSTSLKCTHFSFFSICHFEGAWILKPCITVILGSNPLVTPDTVPARLNTVISKWDYRALSDPRMPCHGVISTCISFVLSQREEIASNTTVILISWWLSWKHLRGPNLVCDIQTEI